MTADSLNYMQVSSENENSKDQGLESKEQSSSKDNSNKCRFSFTHSILDYNSEIISYISIFLLYRFAQ